jgi:hypothetical protein
MIFESMSKISHDERVTSLIGITKEQFLILLITFENFFLTANKMTIKMVLGKGNIA